MYSDEIRSIVIGKLNEGISVAAINNEYKISKKNIHNWYRNYKNGQVILVRELIKNNKLEEALIICQKKEFLNYPAMLSCQIKIFMLQNKIEEILKLSLREDLIDNETIQSQIIKILIDKNELVKAIKICERESFSNSETMQILRKKILMRQEFKNKEKSIGTDEKITESPLINKNQNNIDPNKDICVIFINNIPKNKVIPKKKIIKNKGNHNKKILIKNLFEEEVLQIGAYLYLHTGKIEIKRDAIKALDNFLILIEKPVDDKEALKRIIELLEKMKNDSRFNIKVDEKRYSKYMK